MNTLDPLLISPMTLGDDGLGDPTFVWVVFSTMIEKEGFIEAGPWSHDLTNPAVMIETEMHPWDDMGREPWELLPFVKQVFGQ